MSTVILSQHWLTIQGVLFPNLKEKLGPLSEFNMELISTLELAKVEEFIRCNSGYRGRPSDDRVCIAHAFIAKAMLNLPTTSSLIDRLKIDRVLRQICGWAHKWSIPSESTFSRAFSEFAKNRLIERIHESLIKRNTKGHLFGHVSRDSTAIVGWEKCQRVKQSKSESIKEKEFEGKVKGKSGDLFSSESESESEIESEIEPSAVEVDIDIDIDVDVDVLENSAESSSIEMGGNFGRQSGKRKRGRPKGSKKKLLLPTRLERQREMNLEEMLEDLPKSCDMGCKRSRGYKEMWKGYKFHIDVSDGQLPISCLLTSASLSDSQAAIPLGVMTSRRITNLYDLMDSAYDSAIIREHSQSLGHVPIIEMNPRRNKEKQKEYKTEPKRLQILNIKKPDMVRYNERNSVERVNNRLKNEFGGKMVRVRGNLKVMAHLMFGILALTADQLMRFIL